ncbi:MAG: hypothetical protein ACOCQ1_00495 [Halanaerobiaceae bacterium]
MFKIESKRGWLKFPGILYYTCQLLLWRDFLWLFRERLIQL